MDKKVKHFDCLNTFSKMNGNFFKFSENFGVVKTSFMCQED